VPWLIATTILSRRLVPALAFRHREFHWPLAGQLTSFGGWMLMGHFAWLLRQVMDPLILNKLAASLDVTCFYLGSMPFRRIEAGLSPVHQAILPQTTAIHALQDTRRLQNAYLRLSRYCLWASLLAGIRINGTFLLTVLAYLLLQIAYCTVLKKIILLDVFAIASEFFLRVAAGSAAIEVPMSQWLLICTIFVSLFLALAKRRHELLALGEDAGEHRKVLEEYNLLFLDQMVSIATAGTIASYSLYTLSQETIAKFGTSQLSLTVPIVLYGVSRYLYWVYRHGDGGRPEELVWKDRPLLACVAVYVVSVVLILYSHSGSLS